MDDMQKLYQQALENLAKSTAVVPTHLQGATGALSWWQGSESLLSKAQMPWDKKDEEEAEEEDKEHDEKDAKAKKDNDAEDSDDEGEEDEAEDEDGMEKSISDQMVRMRQKGYDRETSDLNSFVNTDGPAYANMIAKDEIKNNPMSLDRYKGMKQSSDPAAKKRGVEGYEYNRARRAAARDWLSAKDVQKSLDELSAAADRLQSLGKEDESPLLKSIAALNRLAGE